MARSRIDFAAFDASRYFPALDGLRALCVLVVMFNHVRAAVPPWLHGALGVDVFFVLSGFLITTLMIREQESMGGVSLRGFYTRRFFRIIPVYLVTVLLYLGAVHATHDAVKTAQFAAALPWLVGVMQEYRPETSVNIMGHAWTVGIEEKFYVFWPLLLIALLPCRGRRLLVLGAIFAAVLLFPLHYARSYDGLLMGAILGIALSASARWQVFNRLSRVPDTFLGVLTLLAYVLYGHDPRYVLCFSAAVTLVVASLVLRPGHLRTLLENRVLVFIGRRSYAMYLIHVLVLNAVEKSLPQNFPAECFVAVILTYALALVGAQMLYVSVERPFVRLGRRLSAFMQEQRLASRIGPEAAVIERPDT